VPTGRSVDGLSDHVTSGYARRALTAWELDQINATARISGNDAILDALLLRLHTEMACRRGGALAIRLQDLDTDRCLVKLREEGSTVRWQPITQPSPTAWSTMLAPAARCCPPIRCSGSATASHSPADDTTTSGNASATDSPGSPPKASPPTGYNTPPSPGSKDTSATASPAPTPDTPTNTGPATTTNTNIKASLQEVATALTAMTGQPNPTLP
jgi:hypothetical protein